MAATGDAGSNWMDAWLQAQRSGWERFFAAAGQAAAPGGPPLAALFAGQPPGSAAEVSRKLLEAGEGYLGVAAEFWKVIERTRREPPADPAALRAELEGLRDSFTQGFARLYGAGPAGADLFAAWQQFGAAFAAGPAAAPAAGLPALGLTRERQQALERLQAATQRLQRALAAFTALQGRIAGAALDRLAATLAARAQGDEAPTSLRAVYDLWIDSGEQAWAAAAHGAEFAAAQAELNDALAALRIEQHKLAEDWARAFDLPTRSEVNTLIRRVNTLRRRLRELEEELEQLRGRR